MQSKRYGLVEHLIDDHEDASTKNLDVKYSNGRQLVKNDKSGINCMIQKFFVNKIYHDCFDKLASEKIK